MTLFRKIKTKVKFYLTSFLIKLSLYIKSPKLTSLIFAMIAQKINTQGDFTVLCLGRSIFSDDIKAMATFGKQIQYRVIHLDYWQIIFDYLTEESERKDLTEDNYHSDNILVKGKQDYYCYLQKMFHLLKKLIGFDAVLSGNIGYIVQQELAKVCEETKVPFVVLHKEAIVVSDAYKNFLEHYKTRKFVGAKVLFYNEQCMEGFLDLKIPGLTKDKAFFVGIPRFDCYFSKAKEVDSRGGQIAFFSFLPQMSFRFLTKDAEKLKQIEKRALKFYISVMEFARKHKDIKVIIKTKMAQHYLQYPKNILNEHYKEGIDNLVITNASNSSELIQNSTAVIGFNSTTLIEAIIAGKKIISPYFGDIMKDEPWAFFQRHSQLVNYANSEVDLEKFIFRSSEVDYNPKIKKDFLEKFVSTSRGGASERAETAIIEAIDSYRKNHNHNKNNKKHDITS